MARKVRHIMRDTKSRYVTELGYAEAALNAAMRPLREPMACAAGGSGGFTE
jgi:hypothetical protein